LLNIVFVGSFFVYASHYFHKAVGVKSSAVELSSNSVAFGLKFFSELLVKFRRVSCSTARGEYECFLVGYLRQIVGKVKQSFMVFSKVDS